VAVKSMAPHVEARPTIVPVETFPAQPATTADTIHLLLWEAVAVVLLLSSVALWRGCW
jgi:hypothetical protein